MLVPQLHVEVVWRQGVVPEAEVRARVRTELQTMSWLLSEMQALVHDADRMVGREQAWLLPKLVLRLPLYDFDVRYRLVLSEVDGARIALVDEGGRTVADVLVL